MVGKMDSTCVVDGARAGGLHLRAEMLLDGIMDFWNDGLISTGG